MTMNTRAIALAAAAVLAIGLPLSPAVRKVRVTAERAAVYVEPNRYSARIDLVEKGDLLNLFQPRKVKDVWYYVSYNSPRYGSRISGFIQESAVELVAEGVPPAEKPVPATPKVEAKKKPPVVQPQPAPAVAAPPVAEPKKAEPKPPPKPEIVVQKPAVIEYREVTGITPLAPSRRVHLPRRSPSIQDRPWAILQPVVPEAKKGPETPGVRPVPPIQTAPKVPAKKVTAEPKPSAEPRPEKPRSVTPSPPPSAPIKPAFPQKMQRGPSPLSVGLGYGSSYGGAGGCLQLSLTSRIALHAGFGLYPAAVVYSDTDWVKNTTLWSAGIRYYPPVGSERLSPYIDLQYGGLRVEAAQVITGIFEFAYIYRHEQKTLWGPSLLAGLEIRLGRLGLVGGLGVSYSLTDWEFLRQRLSLAFEAGVSVRL